MDDTFQIPLGRPKRGEPAALVVPKDNAKYGIDAGAAVVAFTCDDGVATKLIVYFESNRFDAENMKTFEDMAYHAYDRMVSVYPTVAKTMGDICDFVVVGSVAQHGIDASPCAELQDWLARRQNLPFKSEYLKQKREIDRLRTGGQMPHLLNPT